MLQSRDGAERSLGSSGLSLVRGGLSLVRGALPNSPLEVLERLVTFFRETCTRVSQIKECEEY
jgi:hypothetical protein